MAVREQDDGQRLTAFRCRDAQLQILAALGR
ncbi:hypothetical protein RLDS_25195 [Sphingobium lactosutens DS20]|uniref:Uncharacterized protein n=1 Tax=Sphingobium lactosutens DS20 TaxID=1331060 RepID=T0HF60_9SPHN|nr:hypothetical protein RLDS_25195 [Sphingobium lactosutens DS20]